MKKVLALIMGLGIILSTTIAVWGNDTDTPYKLANIAPTTTVQVDR